MKTIKGAGLGLRREMLDELLPVLPEEVDFWEVAPENWIPLGGKFTEDFERCARQAQLSTHGLSLSIGGPDPLDHRFLKAVKHFLDRYNIPLYSEHLSYCGAQGHMYDLMPIPFTEEAVRYVADRVNVVQDIIERPLVLENVSYYLTAHAQMTELEFINAVLSESGCSLLLD
ncbi:MAG: DUF692 family multinuclear iron-containing protein, partial [Pseudomonadota bacterium]|nr:DUF692 family multinuclear iron-containing protein [Pseudomonadota bacterium]